MSAGKPTLTSTTSTTPLAPTPPPTGAFYNSKYLLAGGASLLIGALAYRLWKNGSFGRARAITVPPESKKTDEFAKVAKNYAKFRPHYPPSVFQQLHTYFSNKSATPAANSLVLDIGTGSGQMAVALAESGFGRVIGIDKSEKQLSFANKANKNVEYRTGTELETGMGDGSVQLITAAQAAHWFDLPKFYQEVNRVLVPKGVLAIAGYGICSIVDPPEAQPAFSNYYESLRNYWPGTCDRVTLDSGFTKVQFPFDNIEHKWHPDNKTLTLADFMGYIRTWSAYSHYMDLKKEDPTLELENVLKKHCERNGGTVTICTPFFLVLMQKRSSP